MKQGSSILKMAAIKIIEKSDEQSLVKEDLMSYMKGSKAKQLLSELWPVQEWSARVERRLIVNTAYS